MVNWKEILNCRICLGSRKNNEENQRENLEEIVRPTTTVANKSQEETKKEVNEISEVSELVKQTENELKKFNDQQTKLKEHTRVVLLIGKTGSGKSTLANVISGTNKFKESGASTSVTKDIQKEEFIENNSGISYAVIDTVGIGDTELKKEEVLDKIAEAVYLAREGISQILFVTNGRFDQFEMATYNLLRTIIFDEYVTEHTTIIRTRFEDFEDEEECQADIKRMLSEKELSEIVNSCQERIVHVNNSSLSSKYGKEERNESRKIVLNCLEKKCQNQENYKPKKLQKLSAEISDYMEKKIESKNKLEKKEEENQFEKSKDKNESELKSFFYRISKITNFLDKLLRREKQQKQENSKQFNEELLIKTVIAAELLIKDKKFNLEEVTRLENEVKESFGYESSNSNRITTLEIELKELEETKKLIEEIQKAEKVIRQKVLNHIFHNYDEIIQVAGGDAFINSFMVNNNNSLNTNNLNLSELQEQMKEQKEKLKLKLAEQGGSNKTLDEVEKKIEKIKQELSDLKKQLPNENSVIVSNIDVKSLDRGVVSGFITSDPIWVGEQANAYRARYPFTAREEGELGFNAGDTIFVTDTSDEVWWLGWKRQDDTGEIVRGVFPSNYVINPEEMSQIQIPPK